MRARIFQRPKAATQSGYAGIDSWMLEFLPAERERNEPLMGWWGSHSTEGQVRLTFETREEAVAYAEKQGLAYEVEEPPLVRPKKPKAYADNFRYGRAENWTH